MVGDFMTRKEDLHAVKPTTTVDEGIGHIRFVCQIILHLLILFLNFLSWVGSFVTALETLVEKRITGFPVIDDDWKLVNSMLPNWSFCF